MRYDAYEPLVAPARPTASVPLLVGGIVVTVMVYYSLSYLIWMGIFAYLNSDQSFALMNAMDEADTPGSVIANLMLFVLLSVALAVTLRTVHQRTLWSLIGPLERTALQFWRVGVALVALFAALWFLPMPNDLAPDRNTAFGTWLIYLPLTLLALLIQTSAEELAFRGYIQSQLAARFSSPFVWIFIPSALFGIVHFDPGIPTFNAMVVVVWATLFGMAAADLTARSGTLGPAIALHLINNFSAIAIAAPEGPLDGLALFTFPFSLASTDAPDDLGADRPDGPSLCLACSTAGASSLIAIPPMAAYFRDVI